MTGSTIAGSEAAPVADVKHGMQPIASATADTPQRATRWGHVRAVEAQVPRDHVTAPRRRHSGSASARKGRSAWHVTELLAELPAGNLAGGNFASWQPCQLSSLLA